MKKLLASVIMFAMIGTASAGGGHHNHGPSTGSIVLGTVVGAYVLGQVMNQNRPVVVQQPVIVQPAPQVIYQQPAPQQYCEVRFMQDQFGQQREFTACYYR